LGTFAGYCFSQGLSFIDGHILFHGKIEIDVI